MNCEIAVCIRIIIRFMIKKLENCITNYNDESKSFQKIQSETKLESSVEPETITDITSCRLFEISLLKKIENIIPSMVDYISSDADDKIIAMKRLILGIFDNKKLCIENLREYELDMLIKKSLEFKSAIFVFASYDVIHRLLKECVKIPNISCDDIMTRLISLRYDLYTISNNDTTLPIISFQKKLLDLFMNHRLPTKRDLIIFLSETIVRDFSLKIFGSAVYDSDNANDLDITGKRTIMKCLIDDLKLFFHVTENKNNDLIVDETLLKDFNNNYQLQKFIIRYHDDMISGTSSRRACSGGDNDMNVCIDYLTPILFRMMHSTTPDFWELCMIKSRCSTRSCATSISIRDFRDSSYRDDCPDISVLLKNRSTKTLTPIKCDNEYLELCKNGGENKKISRMDFIFQRIKHVIRYYKKAEIYNFNGQMPFLNNVTRYVSKLNLIPELLSNLPICEAVCMIISEYYGEYKCTMCNNSLISENKTTFMVILPFERNGVPQILSTQTDTRKYVHAQCILEKISFRKARGKDDELEKICDSFFDASYTLYHII
jgi:hypothetical protein